MNVTEKCMISSYLKFGKLYYSDIFYYSVYKNIVKPDAIFFNFYLLLFENMIVFEYLNK